MILKHLRSLRPAEVQCPRARLAARQRQRQRAVTGPLQIVVHDTAVTTSIPFSQHLQRAIYRIGRNRRAAGHGFKHHQAKGFRPARKNKNISGRIHFGKLAPDQYSHPAHMRVARPERRLQRPDPADDFGARNVQPQEDFDILFMRHATDKK